MNDNKNQLQDMSLQELWQLFPIILKEYNSNYPVWFEEEQKALMTILADKKVCRISHIGSTAVQGLVAKRIIDILLELPGDYNLKITTSILENHGWLVMAKDEAKRTIDLNKGYTPNGFAEKIFHLHVKPTGDWGEVHFRDYLRNHAAIAQEYATLKLCLKKQFEHNRDAYTHAKSDFIFKYTELARKESASTSLRNKHHI